MSRLGNDRAGPGRVAEFDRDEARDGWEEGERDGGSVAAVGGDEGLAGDFQRNENQNRRDHRARDEFDDEAGVAENAAEADEQAGQQRVAGAAAHLFVSGLADVGSGLRDAAAQAGDQCGDGFGEEDVARFVIRRRRRARFRCC